MGGGGYPPINRKSLCTNKLSEMGGYPPPPISFWKRPLTFFTGLILLEHTGSKSNSICRVVCAIHNFQVYDIHILPDHDRHPSAISPRVPSLELHFRHRKCSPLYFRAPPFPSCLFPHAGGKYFWHVSAFRKCCQKICYWWKHCQRHNGPEVLSNLTHSTPSVQSRSFNKLWNLGQTSASFCLEKG